MRIKFHTSAGIEPTPSCLPGERLDHYTTEAGAIYRLGLDEILFCSRLNGKYTRFIQRSQESSASSGPHPSLVQARRCLTPVIQQLKGNSRGNKGNNRTH
ncbi:hypothetical protein M8J77_005342 [Diaphorina citri]|nr:hypothetical protein M8J77_005342 [Diaphorina citri]